MNGGGGGEGKTTDLNTVLPWVHVHHKVMVRVKVKPGNLTLQTLVSTPTLLGPSQGTIQDSEEEPI